MSEQTKFPVYYERVAFYGRRWVDYMRFLALDEDSLPGNRILDVAAGTSSFALEAADRGVSVTSMDPLYAFTPAEARERAKEDFEMVMRAIVKQPGYLANSTYKSLEDLKSARWAATERFLVDYEAEWGGQRYQAVSLPNLPFADNSFDYAFCGHFLFLYPEILDFAFHRDSLLELARVAKELRVYPLFDTTGATFAELGTLIADLEAQGLRVEKVPVEYAAIRGEQALLKVTRTQDIHSQKNL